MSWSADGPTPEGPPPVARPHGDDEPESLGALDALLAMSRPLAGARSPEVTSAFGDLVAATRAEWVRSVRRRRSRTAAVVGAGALVLTGVGAAAATSAGWRAPWTDDPALEVPYTAPDGARCTLAIGGFEGTPDAVAAAEALVETTDVLALANLDAALDSYRDADGVLTDGEYGSAVFDAVVRVIVAELPRQGVAVGDLRILQGEERCGADR